MKFKVFIYTLCILLIMLVQTSLLDYIKIFNVKPNLIIVFIVAVGLLRGSLEGAVVGFFLGLAQDMLTGDLLGFYALIGLYLGLILGLVNKGLYRENFLVVIFFTFISTMAFELVVYLAYLLGVNVLSIDSKNSIDLLFPVRNIIFREAVYNCAVSIFIYIVVLKLNNKFEGIRKLTKKY